MKLARVGLSSTVLMGQTALPIHREEGEIDGSGISQLS